MNSTKPEVFIQFVVMDLNEKEVGDFTKFWNQRGEVGKVPPKVSWAGLIDAPNLTLGNEARWPCHWAMQTMSITDTGKVVTCAVDLDAKFIAGNIDYQALKEVWNEKVKTLRQCHHLKQFHAFPEKCINCKGWQAARADYYLLGT